MDQEMKMDLSTVVQRRSTKAADYDQLTPLDWVVLDFTDGHRSIRQLGEFLPAGVEAIMNAYAHLQTLGLVTWFAEQASHPNATQPFTASAVAGTGQSSGDNALSGNDWRFSPEAARSFVANLDDDQCALYLAPRLVPLFRAFVPSLLDSSLDLDLEAQAFIEFLYANLSGLTPHDLLGMSGDSTDKMTVQQAYLRRTKQLHPDRYFRKNVGPFSTHIATLFKAVTRAFNTLQQT